MSEESVNRERDLSRESEELLTSAQLQRRVEDVMRIEERALAEESNRAVAFRGEIVGNTEEAFETVSERFDELGYTALLREGERTEHEIIAMKGKVEEQSERPLLNLVLFLATFVSVLYIGAGYALQDAGIITGNEGALELFLKPLRYIYYGVPFAATLMGILLAHELSHYFVGRRHGSPLSLPYFIPLPINIIGTMGAVIVQKAPMRDRKALLDIGIAGPLGGLIIAIPLLILGLSLSEVGTPPPDVEAVWQEGNSLLYAGLKYLVFGEVLPSAGRDVWLHPVAFAAWAGLLVTMLNLVPIGQLDGGHISYALLGHHAQTLGYVMIGGLIAWGSWLTFFVGNNAGAIWIMWGLLNLLLNRRHPRPLNDVSPLDAKRVLLGIFMAIVFVVLFMPAPLEEVVLR